MQLTFNPIAATGEVLTAEAPPAVNNLPGEVQSDGSGSAKAQPGSQKCFRETMDDILRSTESGDPNGDAQASSSTPESNEEPVSEVALLEIPGLPPQPQQHLEPGLPTNEDAVVVAVKGDAQGIMPQADHAPQMPRPSTDTSQMAMQLKGEGEAATPATGNGNTASGEFEFLKTPIQSEVSDQGTQKTTTVDPKLAADLKTTSDPKPTIDRKIGTDSKLLADPKTTVDPKIATDSKLTAEQKLTSEPAQTAAPKKQAAAPTTQNTTSTEAVGLSEARAVLLKTSKGGDAQANEAKPSPSKESEENGSKEGHILGNAVRAPKAQTNDVRVPQTLENRGQQATLNSESTARMEEPAATKEAQPKSFATLVESIEKGGAETKPINAGVENPLDGVATSNTKNMPNTQSTISNVAKADPAMSQPIPKEEVIQQIVDSAKLRFQNGQGEMRIQLKPESMGHVRLNISTHQDQVIVKVVAELPMVKAVLESNLPQLRAELQGQGLEIDKFEVTVGGEHESQNKEQQTWAQRQNGRRGGGAFAQGDPENQEERPASQHHRQPQQRRETDGVDYFA